MADLGPLKMVGFQAPLSGWFWAPPDNWTGVLISLDLIGLQGEHAEQEVVVGGHERRVSR